MILRNVQLLNDDSLSDIEWDSNGKYTITQANSSSTSLDPQRDDLSSPSTQMSHDEIDAKGSVLIPGGLVHPHVHLDKCYLLDKTPIGDGSVSLQHLSSLCPSAVLHASTSLMFPILSFTEHFKKL